MNLSLRELFNTSSVSWAQISDIIKENICLWSWRDYKNSSFQQVPQCIPYYDSKTIEMSLGLPAMLQVTLVHMQ